MLDRQKVKDYFDEHAAAWDSELIRNDAVIDLILNNAQIGEGCDVLDVACGTGVLVPDYLNRKVKSVTGIDISPEMIHIAREKFAHNNNVTFLCGAAEDTETENAGEQYDRIVIYNAFPHFPDPEKLIHSMTGKLRPGGILTVAHGMSRARIDRHHQGSANPISNGLMAAEELAEIFARELNVICVVSDDRMYQVAGQK